MLDRYTKFLLTVIAAALVALCVRAYAPTVRAASPMDVRIVNPPTLSIKTNGFDEVRVKRVN